MNIETLQSQLKVALEALEEIKHSDELAQHVAGNALDIISSLEKQK